MPKIGFKTENKKAQVSYDFPKLKLKAGERARIAVLQEPEMEYVHNFRKPVIENGKVKMETAKRRDGSEYQTEKMAFVRNPICRGDFSTLEEKGVDPKNCPACKMAQDNPDWMQAPKRRYAMHVIRYRTKSGSFAVADPFAVETLVWSFPDRIFNKLIEFGEELGGDLKKADLMLGPCENENFQKFDITIGQKAEWATSDETKRMVKATLQGGMIPDLKVAIGNDQTEHYMKQDLETIAEAWAQARGGDEEKSAPNLSEGLDNLFDGQSGAKTSANPEYRQDTQTEWAADTKETPADEAPKAPQSSEDDLLGDLLGSSPDEDKPAASKPAAKSDDVEDFDDLLNSI